jgi:hypothetical protein
VPHVNALICCQSHNQAPGALAVRPAAGRRPSPSEITAERHPEGSAGRPCGSRAKT